MTPPNQNAAIALSIAKNPYRWGFDQAHENGSDWHDFPSLEEAQQEHDPQYDGPIKQIVRCHDFVGSLDDCALFEAALTDEEWKLYQSCLTAAGYDHKGDPWYFRREISASAQLRSDCFCKVRKLTWQTGPPVTE